MGIKLYNQVPKSTENSDIFKLFKEELKSLLLSHSFYSVDEFFSFK
jgi:hypothetical protein